MPRYFTLQEANETLTTIHPWVAEMLEIRAEILSRQPEAWPAIEKSAGNGGNPTLSKLVQAFDKLDRLMHRILDLGVLIKDINTGLLDFPALRDGRAVYLCWKFGEDRIEFWHEIDSGFTGREPIDWE